MALGYLRVSTEEQVESGAGLEGQKIGVEERAARQNLYIPDDGWFIDDGVSGSVPPMEREALGACLQRMEQGPASVLLYMRVDRLARSARDLLNLADQCQQEGWSMATVDGDVDLTTPQGIALFQMQAVFAEMERNLIKARTREALAALKARGVRLGRPSVLPVEVTAKILGERVGGDKTWRQIADLLNTEGVPTAHGGRQWWPATVRKVALGQDALTITA
jgi:DNA invertase Pin-like site-specific DNA recombinase